MSIPTTAMIMAAGFGTRMGSLTASTPKPLLRAGGRTLIDHALEHCQSAGVRCVVVNLHFLGDQLRTHLAARPDPEILFSEEQPDILDTGGGLVNALPLLGGDPLFVLNSDAVFAGGHPLAQLAEAWDDETFDALLLLVPREQAVSYTRPGDFFLDRSPGRPRRRGDSPYADYVYTGAQIIHPRALADAPKGPFSLNVIWDQLNTRGRLGATVTQGPWVDVGTPEGLSAADAVLTAAQSVP